MGKNLFEINIKKGKLNKFIQSYSILIKRFISFIQLKEW
jgi:hypothetical protein